MPDLKKQCIIIEDKTCLKLTGVEGVVALTENNASVIMCGEILEIAGNNLKAEKLSVETGELILVGNIIGIKYQGAKEKKGLIKRIFK